MAFNAEQLELLERSRVEQNVLIDNLRAELAVATRMPTTPAGERPAAAARGAVRLVDTRGSRPEPFEGDEQEWSDWSFKLRSYVAAITPGLGTLLEEAEVMAQSETFVPSAAPDPAEDTQLRYLLVMLCKKGAIQIVRTHMSGIQAYRQLSRRYNPKSQARALAQLHEIMKFEFGGDKAAILDRLVVFEHMVSQYETAAGELLGSGVRCAALIERAPAELRTHLLLNAGTKADFG